MILAWLVKRVLNTRRVHGSASVYRVCIFDLSNSNEHQMYDWCKRPTCFCCACTRNKMSIVLTFLCLYSNGVYSADVFVLVIWYWTHVEQADASFLIQVSFNSVLLLLFLLLLFLLLLFLVLPDIVVVAMMSGWRGGEFWPGTGGCDADKIRIELIQFRIAVNRAYALAVTALFEIRQQLPHHVGRLWIGGPTITGHYHFPE